MKALIVIDLQNEFSAKGKRPVPEITKALIAIRNRIDEARKNKHPIAWVRHFNKPNESPAFIPGTWGSAFIEGFGPENNSGREQEFHKDVYGAFTGSDIGDWLQQNQVKEVLITGFYTHGCVSTTAREALMRNYDVFIDADATATCDLQHELLGELPAGEVHRTALMQLANMGASVIKSQ